MFWGDFGGYPLVIYGDLPIPNGDSCNSYNTWETIKNSDLTYFGHVNNTLREKKQVYLTNMFVGFCK
jgi:hypothetical protein